jgi:alanine transaminase
VTLNGGTIVPYYLDESKNWGLDFENIEKQIVKAIADGVNLRAIVIINPGNPTG